MDEQTPYIRSHHHRRRRRRRLFSGSLVSLIAALVIWWLQSHPATLQQATLNAQPGLVPITHISDGDTITVKQGGQEETVRLLGIDTPEVKDPRKPVQCFGEAASAHTKQLLTGKSVRLEPDPEDSDRDKYGRLLRYVYLPDGTLVNAELVRDGYAFAYTVFPITKLDEFRTLERDARDHNRGLWASCAVNDSQQIKQTAGSK